MRQHQEIEHQEKISNLSNWIRLLTVLFRTLIVLGLVLLFVLFLLLIFASFFKWWLVLLAVSLIVFGILFARVEYVLHNRHLRLSAEQFAQEEDSEGEGMSGDSFPSARK